MFTLRIDNHKGQVFELTHNTANYVVAKIDGLTRPPTSINTATAGTIDGAFFNSARMEMRNLVITLILRGDIEANRQYLYQLFPHRSLCTIYFKNTNRDVKIDGYVETLEADLFVIQEAVQISIKCPRPFWEDLNLLYAELSTIVGSFEFPFTISTPIPFSEVYDSPHAIINNGGDAETGMNLTAVISSAVTSITITNETTGESFAVAYSFQADDVLHICTVQNQLAVTVLRDSTTTNLLNYVQRGSKWIKLTAGRNVLTYSVEGGDADFDIEITALQLYGGV